MRIASMVAPSAVGYFRMALPNAVLRTKGHAIAELMRPPPSLPAEQIAQIASEHAELIATADLVALLQPADCPFEERDPCYREMRGALVLECDDDMFAFLEDEHLSKDPFHLAQMARIEKETGSTSIHRESTLRNFESWLRGVDLVTTTTEHLAQVLRDHGAREVFVCPNSVLPDFQRKTPHPSDVQIARSQAALAILAQAKRSGGEAPKVVGWTGAVSHRRDVAPALLALRRLLSVDATTRVVTLGPVNFREASEWKGFRPSPGQFLRFRTVANGQPSDSVPFVMPGPDGSIVWTYYAALESFSASCAVIPLLDTPFNRSKSDVTLLSWSVQGVPSVVSRTGAYALAEEAGLPAIYVPHHDVEAWTKAIRDLVYDRPRARELGEKAKAWVLEHRSFPLAVAPWEKAYARALEIRGVSVEPLADEDPRNVNAG